MPLRDHFRPPLDDITSWDGFYGGWPAMIVRGLNREFSPRHVAGPRVHIGSLQDPPDQDEYEVGVRETAPGRNLVAIVKFVCPTNKENAENRRLFVARCAALLQQRVPVTIIDLVTTDNFNLYSDLLQVFGHADPSRAAAPASLYAAACRVKEKGDGWLFESWANTLILGQPLPTLPLWLAEDLAVPLVLEESYEETCEILCIP